MNRTKMIVNILFSSADLVIDLGATEAVCVVLMHIDLCQQKQPMYPPTIYTLTYIRSSVLEILTEGRHNMIALTYYNVKSAATWWSLKIWI
jgi:hypothetical protein